MAGSGGREGGHAGVTQEEEGHGGPGNQGDGGGYSAAAGQNCQGDVGGGQVTKKHKRAHSRNKSISGRQGFIEEIANGNDFKVEKVEAGEKEGDRELTTTREALLDGPQGDSAHVSKTSLDEIDALPESLRYNCFDFMCTSISIITYLVDLVMDCVVAYYFYHLSSAHGIHHYWYFGLTILFIILPSLTMTGFSFRWYLMDSDNPQLPAVSVSRWLLRLLVLVLQVAPVLRYIDSMRYGILSRIEKYKGERATDPLEKQKHMKERVKYYTLMVYEDADATLLRLYESFMESAPQLVLQIYILLKDPHAGRIFPVKAPTGEDVHHPIFEAEAPLDISSGVNPYLKLSILALSVTSSLISLAWSLVVYHRSLRFTFQNKKNISLLGTVFQFLWHFCSITARVLALSLFATAMPLWIGPLCAAHWILMAVWVIIQRTSACNTQCEEFLFALVLGAIYIFMFFNAKEAQTRYKYLLYYTFSFVENSSIILVWFLYTPPSTWYVIPALTGHYLTFFGGIMFMLCYYLWFHPTGIDLSSLKFGKKTARVVEDAVEPTELVILTREPDPGRGGGLLPTMENDLGIVLDNSATETTVTDSVTARMLPTPQIQKLNVIKTMSNTSSKASDLSAARKLKYMGQKSQDF